MTSTARALKQEMLQAAGYFHTRGWSVATSGNYSARLEEDKFVVTASSVDKGALTEDDFVVIGTGTGHQSSAKPSAEFALHRALYETLPHIRSVMHTHSVYSTLISQLFCQAGLIVFAGYEMLKALHGVTSHLHREAIPVFPNSQDMTLIASTASNYLLSNPDTHAILLESHGLYSWGTSVKQAKRHIEAIEFMLECEYRKLVIR